MSEKQIKLKKSKKEINEQYRKRHHPVQINFKKDGELNQLLENAKNYGSLNKYIKDSALQGKIKVIQLPSKIDEQYVKELHKIGVNLNQITLRLNAGLRDLTEQNELKSIIIELQKKIETIENSIKS